ncbi:MAG: septum formation initiator family protein [Pseudomonadota bacterium]|nr:septum formation initiator family protein [Pseudomonadota bacterium]
MKRTSDSLRKRLLPLFVAPIIGAMIIGYFAYYMVYGERGLIRLNRLQARLETAHIAMDELEQRRAVLAEDVERLRPDTLDLDMIDEAVRRRLHYAAANERIVLIERIAPVESAAILAKPSD